MAITLQFERMKMAYCVDNLKAPSNFQGLQTLAFDKAWECVENYFKACGQPLPKARHGNPSYTCIRSDWGDIQSDAAFQSSLAKGIRTFWVSFNISAHPDVPIVPIIPIVSTSG
jgi:hypothetical protein